MGTEDFASHDCLIQKEFRRIVIEFQAETRLKQKTTRKERKGPVQLIRQKIRQLGGLAHEEYRRRSTQDQARTISQKLF
jgi:hypothetical protein